MTYRTFDGTSQVESVNLGRYSASKEGVSDGSTTQGAVYFSDDVDTGFYSPADNKIALITAGVERLHIDDSGKVGLGAAPGTQFEVNGANPYVTLKNTAAEDTDHGREAKIIWEGIQSGAEESTLGEIVVSHYGSADDQKGEFFFNVNDGSDGTSPTTVLKLNSNGHVGIGEYNPGSLLHVKASDTGIAPHSSSQICLEREGTNYLQFLTAENGTSGLLFGDGSDIDVSKVTYDHNLSLMQFTVETAESLRVSADDVSIRAGDLFFATAGKGVVLGATSNTAANTLDDYEEGTWTPAADGGGTIAGTSITYAGSYTKIGNLVHCHFEATNSAGDIEISSYKAFSGLPFATTSGKSGTGRAMTEDSEIVARQGDIVAAGSTFLINASGSGSGTVSLKANFTYQTDS